MEQKKGRFDVERRTDAKLEQMRTTMSDLDYGLESVRVIGAYKHFRLNQIYPAKCDFKEEVYKEALTVCGLTENWSFWCVNEFDPECFVVPVDVRLFHLFKCISYDQVKEVIRKVAILREIGID